MGPVESRKILIVQAEEAIAELLMATLDVSDSNTLLTATDGRHALELTRAENPAVLFLDTWLAGMDGFEVCRQLKSDPRTSHAKIVMLTTQPGHRERGLEAGADAYVTMPFSPRELLGLLDRMLGTGR